jgi:hypothetical protein
MAARRTYRTMAVVAVLALGTTACGSIAERVTEGVLERAAGGDVDIDFDEDGGSVTVETSEGTARFGAGGTLPDSFPDDVPLPSADYQVAQSFEQSGSDGVAVQVSLGVEAAASDIAEELEGEFAAGGWENESTSRTSGDGFTQITMVFLKDDLRVMLMIMADDGEEAIVAYTVVRENEA